MMAIGAIQAINQVGKKVPRDYSIIGFDGIDTGQIIEPKLTTIKQNTDMIGKTAAEEILKMIEKKKRFNAGKTIVVDGQLLLGDSTRRL
jgi:LacI family transcriptional regulator